MAEHGVPSVPLDDMAAGVADGIFAPPPNEAVSANPTEPTSAAPLLETAATDPAPVLMLPRPKRRLPQPPKAAADAAGEEEPDEFLANAIAAAFAMGGIAALGAIPKPTGLLFSARHDMCI